MQAVWAVHVKAIFKKKYIFAELFYTQIWGILHKTFFFAYGKVNGKFMLTGVYSFYQSFFAGNSFTQWAPVFRHT